MNENMNNSMKISGLHSLLFYHAYVPMLSLKLQKRQRKEMVTENRIYVQTEIS